MPEDNYTCAEVYVIFSKLEAENLKIQETEAATSNITKTLTCYCRVPML